MNEESKKPSDRQAQKKRAEQLRDLIGGLQKGAKPPGGPKSPRDFVEENTQRPPRRPDGGAPSKG